MTDFKSWVRGRNKISGTLPAFSLLEVIIYIAIFGSMMAVLASVTTIIIQTDAKISAGAEVQEVGLFVMNKMERIMEEASSIEIPVSGSGNALSLNMRMPVLNPTRIESDNEILRIRQGANQNWQPLTSSRIRVINFRATRIVTSEKAKAVRLEYTLRSSLTGLNSQSETTFVQTLTIPL